MHNPNRPLVSSVAAGISGIVLALLGAQWWLTALAFICFALGLLVTAVQSVFPQESAHRLAWWRALWTHQQRRGARPPALRTTQQAPVPGLDTSDRRGE